LANLIARLLGSDPKSWVAKKELNYFGACVGSALYYPGVIAASERATHLMASLSLFLSLSLTPHSLSLSLSLSLFVIILAIIISRTLLPKAHCQIITISFLGVRVIIPSGSFFPPSVMRSEGCHDEPWRNCSAPYVSIVLCSLAIRSVL
jgi:hypothetical protein